MNEKVPQINLKNICNKIKYLSPMNIIHLITVKVGTITAIHIRKQGTMNEIHQTKYNSSNEFNSYSLMN